jgi:hypothetical protein
MLTCSRFERKKKGTNHNAGSSDSLGGVEAFQTQSRISREAKEEEEPENAVVSFFSRVWRCFCVCFCCVFLL